MFYLPVVQTQDGKWTRGEITKIRDLAQAWAMRTGFEVKARDAVVLYADDEPKLEVLYTNLTTGNLDEKREKLEMGEGGDHDKPYVIGIPQSVVAWNDWAGMLKAVAEGRLGGAEDGADKAAA